MGRESERQALRRLRTADAVCHRNRFLFEGRLRVANRQTLEKILAEEWKNSAEPLVLRGVRELMHNQRALPPAIRANEDAVTQSQGSWSGSEKSDRSRCRFQNRMPRRRDFIHLQKADTLGISDSHSHCIDNFIFSERHTVP